MIAEEMVKVLEFEEEGKEKQVYTHFVMKGPHANPVDADSLEHR